MLPTPPQLTIAPEEMGEVEDDRGAGKEEAADMDVALDKEIALFLKETQQK